MKINGEKLTDLVAEHGLTLEELADKLKISRPAVSQWKSGESISDANMKELCKMFGVKVSDLAAIDDSEERGLLIKTFGKLSHRQKQELLAVALQIAAGKGYSSSHDVGSLNQGDCASPHGLRKAG